MGKVEEKTLEYVCNNGLLKEYCNGDYVIANFYIYSHSDGFKVSKSICIEGVHYDHSSNNFVDNNGEKHGNPIFIASHTEYDNYIICKKDEVEFYFNEWRNLSSIKSLILKTLANRIAELTNKLSYCTNLIKEYV